MVADVVDENDAVGTSGFNCLHEVVELAEALLLMRSAGLGVDGVVDGEQQRRRRTRWFFAEEEEKKKVRRE